MSVHLYVCTFVGPDGLNDSNPASKTNAAAVQFAGLIQAVQYLRSASFDMGHALLFFVFVVTS